MNLTALIQPTGAQLRAVETTIEGRPYVIPGGSAAFSLVAELAPSRGIAGAYQPAPVPGGASACVVLFGDAGGSLVPLARAVLTDLSPSPLHLFTVGGLGFASYRLSVVSAKAPLRLFCRPVAYGGAPMLITDPRALSPFGSVPGLPPLSALLPSLDGSRSAGLTSIAPVAVPLSPAAAVSITGGVETPCRKVRLASDSANPAGRIVVWGSDVDLASGPIELAGPLDNVLVEIDDASKLYCVGSAAGLVLRVGVAS